MFRADFLHFTSKIVEHSHYLLVLNRSAAPALFMQRARALLPAFQLTTDNVRLIADICLRLDGLPLAIELAAARIKLLPPQALLARLIPRLAVLTNGAPTLPLRQQTLRNTLQWSYDLLEASEQWLFRRVSVFVGGCTLEALAAVCGTGGRHQTSEVLSGVSSSLLCQMKPEGEEPRLAMLETVREYALSCLEEHGETEDVRRAHALCYLSLAEEIAVPGRTASMAQAAHRGARQPAGGTWLSHRTQRSRTGGAVERRTVVVLGQSWLFQ